MNNSGQFMQSVGNLANDFTQMVMGQPKIISPVPPTDTMSNPSSGSNPLMNKAYINDPANNPNTNPALAQSHSNPSQSSSLPPLQAPTSSLPSSPPSLTPPSQSNTNLFSDFTTQKVPDQFAPLIHQSAVQNGIDPNVYASVLMSEHGFSTTPGYNYNSDGSYDRGIAQLNSKTVPDDSVALNPQKAIPLAAQLLGRYIKEVQAQGGTLAQGIAAYNVGVGGAMANGKGVLGPNGTAYLNKITAGLTPSLRKKLGL